MGKRDVLHLLGRVSYQVLSFEGGEKLRGEEGSEHGKVSLGWRQRRS